MQTFLPYPSFTESMRCLDPSRLGNQVYRECLTLIRGGWPNHPISKMWKGYEHALAKYALEGIEELNRRGRNYQFHRETFEYYLKKFTDTGLPPWIGNEAFHSSHRAVLLYKLPSWYSQFGWIEKPAIPNPDGKLPYVWLV